MLNVIILKDVRDEESGGAFIDVEEMRKCLWTGGLLAGV